MGIETGKYEEMLIFEALEPRLLLDGSVMISEFMADNDGTLLDEDNDYPDWLEIHNYGTAEVDLEGWQLEDEEAIWTFPPMSLGAGEYRVIFASDKDRRNPAGELHANFKLKGDGEYLALLDDVGTVVHRYDPKYPEQLEDISYGMLYDEEGKVVLVNNGDAATYTIPTATPDPSWMTPTFDDSTWSTGDTGLGFGLNVPDGSLTLIGKGSSWKYLDDGSDQGTAWRGRSFDDSAWAFGPAQLGYGDGDENTVVSYGGDSGNKYITTYFRHEFDVDNAWAFTDLTINVQRDDGAVVYLNGQEIARSSMPSGGIDYLTKASAASSETEFFEYHKDPTGILVEGNNVLTVEIHQIALTSSDISFDLELIGDTSTSGLIKTDLTGQMFGVSASALVRVPFTVVEEAEYSNLSLEVAYEDGYVAYLNGTRVAVRNAPDTPDENSTALSDRAIQDAVQFETVDLTGYLDLLVDGENVLAVHALNDGVSDPIFLISPRLTALEGLVITEQYFTTPTPGAENIPGVLGMVSDTRFSADRGFYTGPVDVEISTNTSGAEIRYTLDGSEPTATTGVPYTAPIHIDGTSLLRAAAYKPGYFPTDVDTQTYIFLDDVITQSTMSTAITQDPFWGPQMQESLLDIPTISLVTPHTISQTERETSIEMIFPDGTVGFQVDAGVEHYGGAGLGFPKKSMRISFKGMYGPRRLQYELFGNDAADNFDQFILRTGSHDAMFYNNVTRGIYIRNR
ncbi:MAG: lamin tail domain-containing protein [Phycisphaerae bacterium]|jgi:hypothetical protein|nr:lamin tail domain-containing protein [Phycisphaerae bacterium]